MSQKTVTIIIATKRIFGTPTESAVKFTTSGYGGKIFNIPHSQILKREGAKIKVNENTDYPAVKYTITSWIYKKIKEDYLDKMSDHHYILVEDEQKD